MKKLNKKWIIGSVIVLILIAGHIFPVSTKEVNDSCGFAKWDYRIAFGDLNEYRNIPSNYVSGCNFYLGPNKQNIKQYLYLW